MTQAALDKDTMVAVTPEWHGPSEHPDHGEPVIAEFHEWDVPTNPAKEHTVWWYEGQWRTYPNTDDRAYVNRWRRIPARHHTDAPGTLEGRLRVPLPDGMCGQSMGCNAASICLCSHIEDQRELLTEAADEIASLRAALTRIKGCGFPAVEAIARQALKDTPDAE